MKIIYHCFGGAHSSVVAAHLHLENIPMDGKVNPENILALPEFDRATPDDWGKPQLVGVDGRGDEVYILGLGNDSEVCTRAIISLCYCLGKSGEVILVETLPSIGILTRVGGFISKVLGIKNLGKIIAARGIIRSLSKLKILVMSTKKYIGWIEKNDE